MTLKCIIVDDEPLAIEVLESYIEKMETVELVGKFRNAIKAFEFLQSGEELGLMFFGYSDAKIDRNRLTEDA